jgi:hypothetical protein
MPFKILLFVRGLFTPSIVLVVGGRRVGVVGYLTPETLGTIAHPKQHTAWGFKNSYSHIFSALTAHCLFLMVSSFMNMDYF